MKIGICQINPTVGAINKNKKLILENYDRSVSLGAELVVFPELALTGYPPQDLLLREQFLKRTANALDEIANDAAPPMGLGCTLVDNSDLFNCAFLCENGKITKSYDKILLPTYDVFDEKRYFSAGEDLTVWPLEVKGKKINLGIQICEDLWDDDYDTKVSSMQKKNGADFLINISASPFREKKFEDRVRLITRKVKEIKIPFLYCNLVGAQDELVFDGSSIAVDGAGNCIGYSNSFVEDILFVDLNSKQKVEIKFMSKFENLFKALSMGVKDYFDKTNNSEAVIGLSGGIDSAVVACLAVNALGNDAVYGISMPSKYSSDHSKEDAKLLADNLGINFESISIEKIVDSTEISLNPFFSGTSKGVAEENIQSRARGNLLMALSNKFGRLVLSTGNKTELALGYCTLYGDMSGGLSVISDLNKDDVYGLAKWINKNKGNLIPNSTLIKPPSAELSPDQVDPFDYEIISPLVDLIVEKQYSNEDLINEGFDKNLVKEISNKITINEYKRRQAPIGIRVSKKAFGAGRRFPIINHFREDVK